MFTLKVRSLLLLRVHIEPVNELEGDELVNDIEGPCGIVEGARQLWEGEEYDPEHALNADRT